MLILYIRNKVATFLDYIRKVDICFITETWLNEQNNVIRKEITPDGYVFKDHSRSDRRGGGTRVLCRSGLSLDKITGGERQSFEYSE